MQLVFQITELKQNLRQVVPWAQHSSDPPKLRSLLRNPSKFPAVQLYLQQCSEPTSSSYAVARDTSVQGGERYSIYGNLLQKPDYEHAAEQIISILTGNTCRFSALPAAAVPAVRAVFSRHGYKELYHSPCWEYTLQGPVAEQLQRPELRQLLKQQLGNQYELSTLQLQEAELVNNLWTYKGPDTLALIQQLITGSHTSCIRSQPGKEPVAWMLETDPGMAGILHTVQQHRRKGLARIVLLDLLRKLQQQELQDNEELHQQQHWVVRTNKCTGQLANGYIQYTAEKKGTADGVSDECSVGQAQQQVWPGGHVYAYVIQDNIASLALFESLGLTRSGELWWVGFEKQQQQQQ